MTIGGTTHLGNIAAAGNVSVAGTLTVTGTQTFTGAATFSGGITTTTIAASGAVTLATTLAVTGASTFTAAATFNGGAVVKAGTGTGTYSPIGALSVSTTQVATGANTTETDGFSSTLPANSLSANGKGVRLRLWGTTGATGNNKTVKLYFGGTAYYTTGAVAANNKDWYLEILIVRTGASTQKIFITGHFNGTLISASTVTTGNKDLTTDLTIKNTMTNGTAAASDITTEGAVLDFVA